MVPKLLVVDPDKRLTLEEVEQHPWIVNQGWGADGAKKRRGA